MATALDQKCTLTCLFLRFSSVLENVILHTFIRPVGRINPYWTDKNRIVTRTQRRCFDAILFMLTSFSAKYFDVNVVGKSRTEHFFAVNLDTLAFQ